MDSLILNWSYSTSPSKTNCSPSLNSDHGSLSKNPNSYFQPSDKPSGSDGKRRTIALLKSDQDCMISTDKDLVLPSKQSLDCRAKGDLGAEGANLTPNSKPELTSISNNAPSFQDSNDPPFSKPTGPSEFLTLPKVPQPSSCSIYESKSGVTGLEGADLTLLPNTAPSAQESNQSDFSSPGGPTEFIPLPQAPHSNDSGKYGTETGVTGLEGVDLTLLPNTIPSAQESNQSDFSSPGGPTEFIPLPQAPPSNDSGKYGTETGVTGLESVDLTLHPQMTPDYRSDRRNIQCYWCNDFGHYASECTNKTRPDIRVKPNHLPRCGRCYNCLKYGENVLNCRGPPTQSPNQRQTSYRDRTPPSRPQTAYHNDGQQRAIARNQHR